MIHGSLFSGIGGFDLAARWAGIETAWQVENEPYCQKVLRKHFSNAKRYDDIKAVNGRELKPVDIISGGFPCQPFSCAGQRRGADDDRFLWPEMLRIISEVRPAWVIAENVPGILNMEFGRVLSDLEGAGYETEAFIIPACAVDAPHIRQRVWIVAHAERDGRGSRRAEFAGQERGATSLGSSVLADTARFQPGRTEQRPERERTGECGKSGDVSDADKLNRRAGTGWENRPEAYNYCQWIPEPDVGRVAARLSGKLDRGLNAHEMCLAQARAAGIPQTIRLQFLRKYIESTKASSESERCSLCGHPMSSMPCEGACSPWYLGKRIEEKENMRCMREGLLGIYAQQKQDMQPFLSFGAWKDERQQKVGERVNRLKALGNAIVPQVAFQFFKAIKQIEEA